MRWRRTPPPGSTAPTPTTCLVASSLDTSNTNPHTHLNSHHTHAANHTICSTGWWLAGYPGESLADVEQRWGGDGVSEVRGGEQQGRHLQVDQLQTQTKTNKQGYTAEDVCGKKWTEPLRGRCWVGSVCSHSFTGANS